MYDVYGFFYNIRGKNWTKMYENHDIGTITKVNKVFRATYFSNGCECQGGARCFNTYEEAAHELNLINGELNTSLADIEMDCGV